MAGENIDVESSGDRWALNKVRNELVYPRIFFVCVALSVLLTFPKAQGKNLVGLAIRHKEDLVHEPRLVFKDWEDPIVNGFGELSYLSRLGPDGNDSGEHSVPPLGFVGSVRHKPKLGGVERQLPKIVQGQVLDLELPNTPGALGKFARKLAQEDINITLGYATGGKRSRKTTVVLAVSDLDKGDIIR